MRSPIYALASLLVALAVTTPARADTISTFDSDLEGWTATGGAVVHITSGGNTGGIPDGFLQLTDNLGTWMTVWAPSDFLGDMSANLDGTIAFDAKGNKAADLVLEPLFGQVTIVGSGATATRNLAGIGKPTTEWQTYSAALIDSEWTGNLAGALANVTSISVVLEFTQGDKTEIASFDNFRIAEVPTPSSVAALIGMGLMGLVAVARRRQRKA